MRIIKFPEQISEDIIHYTFLDDIISYNCEKCRGSCCHVNNSLLLDAKTASFLKRTYLKDFIVSDDSVSLLSCGKKCWFHSELGCTINDLGLNKPLTCELYPFHIKKIQNFYIVSFTPCPTFQLNLGEGQRYKDIEDVVLRYIKTGVPVFSPSLHVSEERLKYEIEYQNNFKKTLSEYYRTKTADGTTEFKEYEKWYIYYLDFRWGSIPLSYTSSQANQFWNLYKRVCEDVYKKISYIRTDNIYFIIANQFNKTISKHFQLNFIDKE